ncbi:acyl-CoA N-acyltransferase [Amniculicola lignicola CBS 123094]|uniref:Acyl-CoA N-acyltransferase n=1 Tax=Amniculicola lignicola CBS 123094 TaxID=1392246 RepID=A0A6A5WB88_9PLEO|nr:acyl-CoA N-acyltransferase [Amniculicola lignicola CBS 123094]
MAPKILPGDTISTTPAPYPSKIIRLTGRHAIIVGISTDHAADMYAATSGPSNEHVFTYMFDGPYSSVDEYAKTIETQAADNVSIFYSVLLNNGQETAVGRMALFNIAPQNRSIEAGSILFSPRLQKTAAATEAHYMLAKYVFELGYGRYEWKCNSLNHASKRAADRLGFTYEGLFRQHMVQKGTSRDTWWGSMLNWEWEDENGEGIKRGFETWLDRSNFDEHGRQRKKLEECRKVK